VRRGPAWPRNLAGGRGWWRRAPCWQLRCVAQKRTTNPALLPRQPGSNMRIWVARAGARGPNQTRRSSRNPTRARPSARKRRSRSHRHNGRTVGGHEVFLPFQTGWAGPRLVRAGCRENQRRNHPWQGRRPSVGAPKTRRWQQWGALRRRLEGQQGFFAQPPPLRSGPLRGGRRPGPYSSRPAQSAAECVAPKRA